MSKTEQLNQLFTRWQEEISEYQGHFIYDGIINEELYNKQKNKLLFIAKEPNDPDQTEWDFRDAWKEKPAHIFTYRIN